MSDIPARAQRLRRKIAQPQESLRVIQDQVCQHPEPALEWEHGSSTGYYDPSADSYWTDFHCRECDKRWRKKR